MKFPKSLALCADKYYKLKQERLELSRKLRAMEEEERAYKNHLIDNVPKSKATGVQGKVARVVIVTKDEPIVEDQDKFRKYLNRTKNFYLAQNLKPSAPAIKEVWEDGKKVPGIGSHRVVTVSLTKV